MSNFAQDELYDDGGKKYVMVTSVEKDSYLVATKTRVVSVPKTEIGKIKGVAGGRLFIDAEGAFVQKEERRNASTGTGRAGCSTARVNQSTRYLG